jgi:hypothetical protein
MSYANIPFFKQNHWRFENLPDKQLCMNIWIINIIIENLQICYPNTYIMK